jgi:hypothetical protein
MRICEIRYSIFSFVIIKQNEIFSPDGNGILLWRGSTQKIQCTAGGLVFENINSSAPEKTSTCQVVHNS